jgi:hypothetical protein
MWWRRWRRRWWLPWRRPIVVYRRPLFFGPAFGCGLALMLLFACLLGFMFLRFAVR